MFSSIFFIAFSIIGAIFGIVVVYRNKARLEEVSKRIGPFFEGLNTEHPRLLFTIMLFYIKRFLYAIILLFLLNYPVFQVLCCLFIIGFHIIYLIVNRPMESSREHFFEVFNEVMVFITTASVLCFTDAYEGLE